MASRPVGRPGLPIPALGSAGPELQHKAFLLPGLPDSGLALGPSGDAVRRLTLRPGSCPRATFFGLVKFEPDSGLLTCSGVERNTIL